MPETLPSPTEAEPFDPSPRVTAPWQLREVYGDLYQADRVPNEDRATVLDGLSGGRPFDEGELQIMGRPDLINFNWGEGEQLINSQISLYNKMLQGAPYIARFTLRSDLKIPTGKRREYEDILADEFHRLNFRRWRRFFWSNLQLLREYVTFGVAFAYFGDDMDWRWHPGGLNHVKVQRMQKFFGPDCTETAFIQQDWTAADLVAPLRNGDEAAKEQGWDPEALRKAINYIRERTGFNNNLEQFIHEIKNNELYYRSGRAKTISVLFNFTEEFDGKISWYILTEDASTTGSNKDDNFEAFLFKKEKVFDTAADVFIPHVMAVSTGEIHSVRGLGHRIFEPDVQRNRMMCMMLTNCLEAGSPMVQASDEDSNTDWNIFRYGGSVVLPPGLTYVDRKVENLAPNLQFANSLMERVAENVGGVMYNRTANSSGQPETATQVRAVTDTNIQINESERLNFLESRGWLYTAQWNRIKKSKATYPGGEEALSMIKRCRARGVPAHIIKDGVEYVEPMTSMITPGTTVTPDDQLKAMMGLMDKLPPSGRQQVMRAAVGHFAGWYNADSILPAEGDFGPGWQGQMAIHENGIFSANGGPLPVLMDQDHLEHAIQHAIVAQNMEKMASEALNSRENEQIFKGMKIFGDFVDHFSKHVAQLQDSPAPPPEFPQLKQMAMGMHNAVKALTRAASKIMLANQRNEPGTPADGGGPDAGDMAHDMTDAKIKMAQAEQEMRINQELHTQDLTNRQKKQDLLMDNMKIKTAAKVQAEDTIGSAKALAAAQESAAQPTQTQQPAEQMLGF